MNQGKVPAFGPALDPNEVYGLGIVSVQDEQEVKDLIAMIRRLLSTGTNIFP